MNIKKTEEMTNEELISKTLAGDLESVYRFLYKSEYARIKKFVIYNGGVDADAEDVFQEALVIVYKKILEKNLNPLSNIFSYTYTICRNIWLNQLRRQSRKNLDLLEIETPEEISTEQNYILGEDENIMQEKLKIALDRLPPSCKKLLTEYYLYNKTSSEIASELNFASPNVEKVMRSRCMRKLQEIIKELNQ